MILQSLVEYYDALADRDEIARPGWVREKISFAVNLSDEGELLNIVPFKQAIERNGKTIESPITMTVPERVVRAAGIKANFLCENAIYLLALDIKGDQERTVKCFEACKNLHLEILKNSTSAMGVAIKGFFNNWKPDMVAEHPIIQPYCDDLQVANLVIMVEGKFAHEDNEVKECWERHTAALSQSKTNAVCLVTGKKLPASIIHGKIKGIPGGQSAGMTLVGFNARAYESYGKNDAQGLNAPVSEYATFAYVTALNRLLADREHCQRIGDTSVVYWTEKANPVAQRMFTIVGFTAPNADADLEAIMKSLAANKPIADVDMEERFYILGLAPNAARISVRFFLQDSFGAMVENVRRHYMRLEIIQPAFNTRHYLSVSSLLYQTVNPNSRDKASSPLLSGAVMRAILTGGAYPYALYSAVINRIRADRNVSAERAAIIKAFLIHNHDEKEVTSVALNETTDNRAYVLGRLFAVLEDAQQQANPGINTTIKDRYFTSACTTPGSVFPQLLKLSAYHTAKAEYGYTRENQKIELLGKLKLEDNPFPTHHSLQEQGIFILGYYHQVQFRYTKKEDKIDGSN